MLTVDQLLFEYGDQPLLTDVSFTLEPGQLLHLCGRNGAGKTTLLQLIAGLLTAEAGTIQYEESLCYLGHKPGFNPHLTVWENAICDLQCWSSQAEQLEFYLKLLGLEHLRDYPSALLSAGQKRKLSLLKLWLTSAKLWLLDEPLVALDEEAIALCLERITQHCQQGGMVILTSHQSLTLPGIDCREYRL